MKSALERKGGRVVEGTRLESVHTARYRGFESRLFRSVAEKASHVGRERRDKRTSNRTGGSNPPPFRIKHIVSRVTREPRIEQHKPAIDLAALCFLPDYRNRLRKWKGHGERLCTERERLSETSRRRSSGSGGISERESFCRSLGISRACIFESEGYDAFRVETSR